MNKQRVPRPDEDLNFWQSTAGLLSPLLLLLAMVILLLTLVSAAAPPASPVPEGGEEADALEAATPEEAPRETPLPARKDLPLAPGATPVPGSGAESAVLVRLADAETRSRIREAGIPFELLDGRGTPLVLGVHYPEPAFLRTFDTLPDGTFLLPEKLPAGRYTLRALGAPAGYRQADPVTFELSPGLTWDRPLQVAVPFPPSRSRVRLEVREAGTGAPLPGVRLYLMAAGEIRTGDGTLRLYRGDIAATLTTDESGQARSPLLFPGTYVLHTGPLPDDLASPDADPHVTLKASGEEIFLSLTCARTSLTLRVRDEHDPSIPVPGAAFALSSSDRPHAMARLAADGEGNLLLTNLRKGVTYTLRQLGAPAPFLPSREPLSFRVDASGHIEGHSAGEHTLLNRCIRASIAVTGLGGDNRLSGIPLTLTDADGRVVDSFASSQQPHLIEGIPPGDYTLSRADEPGSRFVLYVRNTAEVQNFSIRIIPFARLIVPAAAALAFAALLTLTLVQARRRRRRRQDEDDSGTS